LYHGVVDGCVLDNGIVMTSDKLNGKYFSMFDYTLLGDIHKRQYLSNNKRIAYAGSLIQQNFGESLDKHGLIRWDLNNGTS
jgi:DNA repair exonuclease SbcCD nuclease subunit